MKKANEIVKHVTEHLIKQMECDDGGKWLKGWTNKAFQNVDGHNYSGMNLFWLSMIAEGFLGEPKERKVYGTYLQWKNKGCQVKKGSKSVQLLKPIIGSKDVEVETPTGTETATRHYKFFSTFNVFNIEDVEGDVSRWDNVDNPQQKSEVEVSQVAESYVKNTGAIIKHIDGGNAYYVPSHDEIFMPDKTNFISTKNASATDGYYGTLFHELTHWTGDAGRCNRNLSGWKGSTGYAFEELVAEMGSAFLCNQLGISATPRVDHAKYLKSWIRCLKDKPTALMNASGLANKSLIYLNGLQLKEIKDPKIKLDTTKEGYIQKVEVKKVA